MTICRLYLLLIVSLFFAACTHKHVPNQEMVDLLKISEKNDFNPDNVFSPKAIIKSCDSILDSSPGEAAKMSALTRKADELLKLGEEQKSIDILQSLLKKISLGEIEQREPLLKNLAISYMRLGERINCFHNHNNESCIFPISNGGIHQDKTGSEKAIEIYKQILMDNPGDLESRWLLNIAYMTTGGYPQQVPPQFLLKVENDDSMHLVKPFRDVAANMGLNYKCIAGGCIVDDFNNDDYPDIVLSSWSLSEPMRYYRNNAQWNFYRSI